MRTLEGQGLNRNQRVAGELFDKFKDESAEGVNDGTQVVERGGLADIYYAMRVLLSFAGIEPNERAENLTGKGGPQSQIYSAMRSLFANRDKTEQSQEEFTIMLAKLSEDIEDLINFTEGNLNGLHSEIDKVYGGNVSSVPVSKIHSNVKLNNVINDLSAQITNDYDGIRRAYFRIAPNTYTVRKDNISQTLEAVLLSSSENNDVLNQKFAYICQSYTIVNVAGRVRRHGHTLYDILGDSIYVDYGGRDRHYEIVMKDFALTNADFHIIIDYVDKQEEPEEPEE